MHGLLLVDKPSGLTSHDVVARIRRLLKTKEVGHSGTLDPLASGLMVLLIGEATKLSSYITEGDKAYNVGIKLGVTTDTLDITGQVLTEKMIQCSSEQILNQALSLKGSYEWEIPLFSAKKVNGQKLYELAREGAAVELPKKIMKFWDIKVLSSNPSFEFSVDCSKGSFVRSWVQNLGQQLGCGATMSTLRRTKSHRFYIQQAQTLTDLESKSIEQIQQELIPLDQALTGVKSIRVKGQDEALLKNGQISHHLRSQLIALSAGENDEIFQIKPSKKGALLALVSLEKGLGFKIRRVFNY